MPFIDCGVIVDTGSSDDTVKLIKAWADNKKKHIEVSGVPFLNFSQARNAALARVRNSKLEWDYLLLIDADMELRAEEGSFEGLVGPAYSITQTDGRQSLNNIRLLRRDQTVVYEGPTHEWLAIQGTLLKGVVIRDYMTGPSRKGKALRDIEILENEIKHGRGNPQIIFNLAHSYYSDQQWEKALRSFGKRIEAGGWGEQVWNSLLYYARSALMLKDESAFVHQALITFNARPTRAEPLYDLARYWRGNGQFHTSLIFSQLGLVVPYPVQDSLFIEDYVYKGGLQHEYDRALVALKGHSAQKKRVNQPVNKLLAKR
jgi:glycosyltransferase involved in cell wall biosynthesis